METDLRSTVNRFLALKSEVALLQEKISAFGEVMDLRHRLRVRDFRPKSGSIQAGRTPFYLCCAYGPKDLLRRLRLFEVV